MKTTNAGMQLGNTPVYSRPATSPMTGGSGDSAENGITLRQQFAILIATALASNWGPRPDTASTSVTLADDLIEELAQKREVE